jgi:hypothetical protein
MPNRQERRAAARQGRVLGEEHETRDLRSLVSAGNRKTRIVIGYCHTDEVAAEFTASLTALLQHDARTDQFVCGPGGGTIDLRSGPRIAEARSQMVDQFLGSEMFAQADWLWMVDSDMVFDGDILSKMMQHAHPERVPILGALAFAGRHYGDQWPTIYEEYREADDSIGVRPVTDFPRDALIKCGATGAAGLLVHRQVYVHMANKFGRFQDGRQNPYPWFQEGLVTSTGAPLGEDIAFCKRARSCGIPTHVHSGILMGHMKMAPLTLATWEGQQREVAERLGEQLVEAVS